MPCDTVRTTTTELAAANMDVLADSLAALGCRVTAKGQAHLQFNDPLGRLCYFERGQLSTPAGSSLTAEVVRREYAKTAVKAAARRFGWVVEEQKQQQKLLLKRRTY